MTTDKAFRFFDKAERLERTPEEQRAGFINDAIRGLACSAGAIGYLVQLSEYKKGRQALEGVTELVQGLRQDLELVQGMSGVQFVAWLEDVG